MLEVSIPHRYCKNKHQEFYISNNGEVSIPHRYCKNAQTQEKEKEGEGLFQFLIGTVKTYLFSLFITSLLMFQFLIGTVKTHTISFFVKSFLSFQFLIGTVKTIL